MLVLAACLLQLYVKLRSHYLLKDHLLFLSLKINAINENLEIGLVLSLRSIMYMSPCILPWCRKAIKILLYWLNYLLPALLTLFAWKLKGRSWQSWTAQPRSTEKQKRGALLIYRASGRSHHTWAPVSDGSRVLNWLLPNAEISYFCVLWKRALILFCFPVFPKNLWIRVSAGLY